MKTRLQSIFTGEEGNSLPLQAALTATAHFHHLYPTHRTSYFLSSVALHALLNSTDCVGVRAYLGLMDSGEQRLVAVGTDAYANDLLTGPIMVSSPCGYPSSFPTLTDWGGLARLAEEQVYQIDATTAFRLTANFQAQHCGQVWGVFCGLQRLGPYLREAECLGLRFYPYADERDQVSLLYTAVNSFGADMLSYDSFEMPGRICLTQCATGVGLFGFSLTSMPHVSPAMRQSA